MGLKPPDPQSGDRTPYNSAPRDYSSPYYQTGRGIEMLRDRSIGSQMYRPQPPFRRQPNRNIYRNGR